MPIDPYALCPGGTGKKIKFCCPDLVGELDRIQTMLEGDQKVACSEAIEKLEAKFPNRACLMSIKAMLAVSAGDASKAQTTVESFLKQHPDNPVALAESAILAVNQSGARAGVDMLQRTLAAVTEQVPSQVYDAIGAVAGGLMVEGAVLAARGHLLLQVGLTGGQDREPLEMLAQLNNSPSLPILLKQDPPIVAPPADATWKSSFDAAATLAARGAWSGASEKLYELASKVGDAPSIWRNLATLRVWLADPLGAVRALRKYASPNIPLDDAVEAEALAQMLDADSVDLIDVVLLEYPILDMDKLVSALAKSDRVMTSTVETPKMGAEDEPPPRSAHALVDRPLAASGAALTREEVSSIIGQSFVFGKQTDRDARLEVIVARDSAMEQAQALLAEMADGALGPIAREEVIQQAPALQRLLGWRWQLPIDTPMALRQELISSEFGRVLLEKWPKMPQKIFGGKSAEAVAADPAYRLKLLAAILLLELTPSSAERDSDFNALRTELGLPTSDAIAGTGIDAASLPLARLHRLIPSTLSDEQLLKAYQRAAHYNLAGALRKLALEVVARTSLDGKLDKSQVLGQLAEIETDPTKALAYLDQARRLAEAAGKSSALWDISELALRIELGDVAEAERLMNHVRSEHIREPGVANALYQVLIEAGVIGPDARPTGAPAADPSGIVVPGAASEPGKIWTPDGDTSSGGKKPAIWTPG